jgi:hypothetical protein
VVVVAIAGFLAGLALPALAASRNSSLITYWGPVSVGGANWCGKVQSIVSDAADFPPNGGAISASWAYYGANCGNTHNVPAGYLGAQVHLVKSDGALCGSTAWSWNGSSASLWTSGKLLSPSGSCPAHASNKSEAHAQHYNPNNGNYPTSSWINSPFLTF